MLYDFLIYGLLLLWLLFHVNLFIKTILIVVSKYSYMQIFLKNPYNKTHTLEIDETDTIRTLFVLINNVVNVPTKFFYLTYSGKVIGPESYANTLLHFDIKKESTLHFHIRSTGNP